MLKRQFLIQVISDQNNAHQMTWWPCP